MGETYLERHRPPGHNQSPPATRGGVFGGDSTLAVDAGQLWGSLRDETGSIDALHPISRDRHSVDPG
jgi:hypothetical protein